MADSLIGGEAPAEAQAEAPAEEQRDFVVAEDQQPERPEWLPEKYKTPEDLAKAYKELESKIGAKEETLREQIVKELEEQAYSGRPADKGDYQLPDFVDEETAVDSELLSWWAEHSFENGFSQTEFEKGIEMYMQAVQGSQPDLEAEAKKLGDNASARIQSASAFASNFFPEEAMPAIERMCETHEGIVALEAVMEAMKDGGYGETTSSASGMNEDSLRQMMADERYWNPAKRDPGFIKQVDQGFAKLYGR
jgi:hypothetical protein